MIDEAQKLLQQYFGYSSFRTGQRDIIDSILKGKNTLGILPTGGGKSLCYQIPAMLFQGTTIVISPLISLMKDQVDSLTTADIPAAFINSSLTSQELSERLSLMKKSAYKLVYVAPERFESDFFIDLLNSIDIPFIAFDEAHCISQWGHDFRPSYRSIVAALRHLTHKPVIAALTATATENVAEDIRGLLKIHANDTYKTGFARENLAFHVIKGENKRDFVVHYLRKKAQQPGIIYAASRKETDHLYSFLTAQGFSCVKYHAGLSEEERKSAQDQFVYDKAEIMIATNAFGMGIDKPNVRFIIHYNLPKNIEAYYQEAGRAGRDGEDSECWLLFGAQDIQLQKFLIEETSLDFAKREQEYHKLNQMVMYCHTEKCLQSYIIQYFDPQYPAVQCGKCSNCKDSRKKIDITRETQMILSCCKRMGERFGATLIAQVLKGSNGQRIRTLGFDQLSTYGLLRNRSEKEIVDMINYLLAEGYLRLTDGKYPVVKITEKAVPVLKDMETVMMKKTLAHAMTATEKNENLALFEILRTLRKEIAEKEQVPPFVIFGDNTLKEICRYFPVTETAMLQIKGVGQTKFAKYGELFLQAIRQFVEDNQMEGNTTIPAPAASKQEKEQSELPSHLVSYQWFTAGMTIKEIAHKRQLSSITVQKHIIRSAQEGKALNWDELFDEQTEEKVLKAIQSCGIEKLKPIWEALDGEVDYFTIQAVICKNHYR